MRLLALLEALRAEPELAQVCQYCQWGGAVLHIAHAASYNDATCLSACSASLCASNGLRHSPTDMWPSPGVPAVDAMLDLPNSGLLFAASGARGLFTTCTLERQFRDAHAINSHIAFNFDVAGTNYGRVALGLPSENLTL